MKYKAIYDVLNERRQTTPGFCYHDRSGWRAYPQTYMTMQCPLWIIAEDAATGRRLWITQEGTRFSISIRRMDEQRHNYGPCLSHIHSEKKKCIFFQLKSIFSKWANDGGNLENRCTYFGIPVAYKSFYCSD